MVKKLNLAIVGAVVLGVGCVLVWRLGLPRLEHRLGGRASTSGVASATASMNDSAHSTARQYTTQLNAVLTLTDPVERPTQFARQFGRWLEEDAAGALEYARHMPRGNEFVEAVSMILDQEQATNPARAVAIANQLVAKHEEMHLYNMLFERIANHSLSMASQLASEVPAGEPRDNAIRAIASVWAQADGTVALNWAANIADPAERSAAMESVLSLQATTQPENAILTARQSLQGAALTRFLEKSVETMIHQDALLAQEITALLPADLITTPIAISVTRKLAQESPTQAAAWISTLPGQAQAQAARLNLLDIWGRTAPQEAQAYVAAMAPGQNQQEAAAFLVEKIARTSPDDAIKWAQSLESPTARERCLIQIASAMAQTTPAETTRWVSLWPANAPGRDGALNAALSYWKLAAPDDAARFINAQTAVEN